jgi:hypothetical protein
MGFDRKRTRVILFNATFNNISVISWRLVLLVEETEYPEKTTDLSEVPEKLYPIVDRKTISQTKKYVHCTYKRLKSQCTKQQN